MICLFPREAIHHHSKSMPQPLCWGSWSWMILWRPTRLPRTNTKKKDVLFILGDWNEKVGSQEIPGITGKFCLGVQNEARQRLTEFCKENTLVIASTHYQQHEKTLNMDITTWSVLKLDWLYSLQLKMEKLYSVSKNKTWSSLWLRSPAYLKIQDKLKKVEKTTRIFRYDLNKIPYDYTVEVTNRFKGSDRQSAWRTMDRGSWHCTGGSDQDHPSFQFSSVAQSCLTLWDPMNRSTPGLPVHHQLLEFTQTHVHRVSDAIHPSHPLSSSSPPAPNLSQHHGLFQWVNSSHEVAKVLEFQL